MHQGATDPEPTQLVCLFEGNPATKEPGRQDNERREASAADLTRIRAIPGTESHLLLFAAASHIPSTTFHTP